MNVQRRWLASFCLAAITAAIGCGGDGQTASTGSSESSGTATGSGGNGGAMSGSGGAMSGSGGAMSGSGGAGGVMGSGGAGGVMSGSGGAGGVMSGSGGAGGVMGSGGAGGVMSGSGGAGGQPPQCVTDAQCDDGFSCTIDACAMGVCVNVANNAMCDDQLYCNGNEFCNPAVGAAGTGCTPSSGPSCDDGIGCTIDACNEALDSCTHTPNNDICGNGKSCDGVETCDAVLGCKAGTPLNCNDNVSCTDDFCDPQADACAHVPNDNHCSNGLFCDGVETCDAAAGCKPGSPIVCNDMIGCTADVCNEALDACTHTANNALCNDGKYCNGIETCDVGVGCKGGDPVICNDGLSCTADSCSDAQAKCIYAPNNAACDNGLACDGVETCDPLGMGPSGCKSGTAVVCMDAWSCTTDACQEPGGTCASTPDNSKCGSGFCNPGAPGANQAGCTLGKACQTAAECSDGDACNGIEVCNVVCQPGNPVVCNDNVPCTIDSCNPQNGACVFAPNNNICDDGAACNGVEMCSPQLGCVMGVPVNCNDNIGCTVDQCDDFSGACVHFPLNNLCDNGKFCDGSETCDMVMGCTAGTPPVCNDGIACTADSCDPLLNACKAIPNNSLCGCGQTCSPANGGCGNFCTVSTCQGKVYACGDCIDNDGDCKIDSADEQCLGPCDNTENSFYGGISGQNNSPCKSDCYFDQDTGAGNDDCYWSHKCDPLEVAPNYPPEGSQCEYNPNANIAGYNGTCQTAFQTQSAACLNYCGPLTPNGCDCFGCCALPNLPYTVWLGSENPSGTGSCDLAHINDPAYCKPCTQVQACLNTCAHCEICIGKPDLPPDCIEQSCPVGVQKCGQVGQSPCPTGYSCITGCCVQNPN